MDGVIIPLISLMTVGIMYLGFLKLRFSKLKNLKELGDWALITGASSGIGEKFAYFIASEGINCVLVARRESKLVELAKELNTKFGVIVRISATDLSSQESAEKLFKELSDINIDILVNNAGIGSAGRFDKQSLQSQVNMVEVNVLAPTVLTHLFLPNMIKKKQRSYYFCKFSFSLSTTTISCCLWCH